MSPPKMSRREISARSKLLKQLKKDHQGVKEAFQRFKTLDPDKEPAECEALVNQVLDDLTLHATLEEELLYPAAREALDEQDLLDEAAVEHESLHALIGQLRRMHVGDDKYGARFTVLCEYAQHHVKEEEGEMFPKLRQVAIGWEDLASRMDARRKELQTAVEADDADDAGRTRRRQSAEGAALSIGPGR